MRTADADPLTRPLPEIDDYVAGGGDPLDFLLGRDAAEFSRLITALENLTPKLVRHMERAPSAQGANCRRELGNLARVVADLIDAAIAGGVQ